MKYKNILLDLDGTVADPFEAFSSSVIYAAKTMGFAVPTPEQVRKCIGPPLSVSMGTVLGIPSLQQNEFLATYREHHGREGIFQYRLYEGMAETLKKLSENSRLYLATSKPTVYAEPILESAGVRPLFLGVVGAELDGSRDHKADIIAFVMKNFSVRSDESIMIGDRMHDGIGAQKHDMDWAGVLWGFGSQEELGAHSPVALLESQKQMLEFLFFDSII